ncbi:maltodextrin glucosidase [Vibrio sp. SCSIO 43136]|uniref:maltodextrin glucosidase n=1 Tax=Vibrio sp. SCSIO 43136 TaxID=2819101 RepID=UPI002076492D|nr:maltodextrin glucosidase [Vibrio sp. SCSIO 43136]USD64434.1 maltodextrin glucosidase [Vibrio sp. SCSIO 43136]
MNTPFLFHSQASDGLILDKGILTVTLKTEQLDDYKVQLRHEPDNEEELVDMTLVQREGRLCLWQASFPINPDRDITHYVFKVTGNKQQFWLDDRGVSRRMPGKEYHFKFNAVHRPPAWVKEQVFYQVFPERFCNGDPSISVKDGEYSLKGGTKPVVAKVWGEPVGDHTNTGGCEFYGGDLQGVLDKLDYLQSIGVTTLYLNPIFASLSNHKYDTTDYFNVDPHFGDNALFATLCEQVHQRGMMIVLDAVFNHTSSEHPWFDKSGNTHDGAFHNTNSPYRNYYFFEGDSQNYTGWKGVQNLPVLNFNNDEVKDYIYRSEDAVIRHWLRPPYNVDGWRFDVIHMLGEGEGATNNAHYVKAFRNATKEENPQAYVLGEHFFEASQWLQGEQEDGAMNYYGFAHPMRALFAKQDIAYDPIDIDVVEFVDWLMEAKAKVPFENQLSQLNQLDSHDTARLLTLLQGDEALMKVASVLLFSYLGVPCLYYGTEVGLEGGQDPDNRRCFPWDLVGKTSWQPFFTSLAKLRNESLSLQSGSLVTLHLDESAWVFARQIGDDVTFIALNLDQATKPLTIPLWKVGFEQGELVSKLHTVTESVDRNEISEGECKVVLAAKSAVIFSVER